MKRPAVFLDRDGLLNELVYYPDHGETESPREPGALTLIPGVETALADLQAAGLPLIVVSNQPSFAKGKTSLENLKAVHARLVQLLSDRGVTLTDAFYCYHHPDGIVAGYSGVCECRKPRPGSLLAAAERHDLDLRASWMVGDQDTDVACGSAAGCHTLLVPNAGSAAKRGHSAPQATAPDLQHAVSIILATHRSLPS